MQDFRKRFISMATLGILLALGGVACGGSKVTTLDTPQPTTTPTTAITDTTASSELSLRWLGHATFILTSSQGAKVLVDPMGATVGYSVAPASGVNVVTVGHEHGDHNNVALATGNPVVLRGLSDDGWNDIHQTVGDISVRTVRSFHDSEQGARRGRNTIFVYGVGDLNVVHLSDLGHVLTPEQVTAVGRVDVLLVPVGGFFTIDAAQATQVVQQLSPGIVVPMHYRTPANSNTNLAQVDDFLAGKKVERTNSNVLRVSKASLPAEMTVLVLNYQ